MSTWLWFAGDNNEWYRTGPHATRDEALAEALREGMGRSKDPTKPFQVIHLIEAQQRPIDLSSWLDVDRMIEELHDAIGMEYGGEDGESPADGAWTDEQHADLHKMIESAMAAWQAKYRIVVTPRVFTAQRNAERVELAEDGTIVSPPDPEKVNADEIPLAALHEHQTGEAAA